MKQLHLIMPDELFKQLDNFVKAQDVPPATAVVIREALVKFLEERGYPVSDVHPKRGGDRREIE